jgi:gliding motility-associated-like protein
MKKAWFALFVWISVYVVLGQACEYLGPDQFLPCGQTSTIITADFSQCSGGTVSPPKETTTYLVQNIPFAPFPNTGTQVFLGDDQVSGALPIGFSFCFFGNTYTNFHIGSNGWISFSPGQPTTFTSAAIPSTAGSVPKNCIMGPWQDWHPGIGGQIRYETQGVAPCRRLVVSFTSVPFFSCTSTTGTFQIILYEGTNIIENHITNKQFCSWAGGTATQGIHNQAGTVAFTVPGRNNTVWTTTNDAWRYTPNGANVQPTLTWYQVGNPTPIATGVNSITVTPPPSGAYYTAVQQYSGCFQNYAACVGATGGIPQDTVFVMPNANVTANFTLDLQYCQGANIPPLPTTSNNNITGSWSPPINNQQTTTYTFTPDPGQCSDPVSITITILPNVTPVFSPITSYCVGEAIPPLPTTSSNNITGTWSPAINNQQTTTYTFTPNPGQCATTTTLTITITPGITPTFSSVGPYCAGDAIPELPSTSTNNIVGAWSPAINNQQTTTYTFVPNPGQCASNTTLTININQPVLPTFNQIGPFCQGAAIAGLPTVSTNNISGSWSPAINNQQTTMYTFTPYPGQCASTNTMTVSINPNIIPDFNPVGPFCAGAAIPPLPTTSTNNISGSWSPQINNNQTTTYNFTPSGGVCALSTSLTITINPNVLPTFDVVGPFCAGQNIPDLPLNSNNGISGTWSPAINNQQTTTYTFTPSSGLCALTTTATIPILPNSSSTTSLTICENQLPLNWNGLSLTSSGNYQAILVAQNGCDSITNLNLTVTPVLSGTTNVTICQNQIPYQWNGNTYTISGVYTANLTASNGCDSIGILNLNVVPMPTVSFSNSIPQGCAPLQVTFTNTSSTIGNCMWNLGNGVVINTCDQVTGIYNDLGCYDVALQITTPEGCSRTYTRNDLVCVAPDPMASFMVTPQVLTTLNPTAYFTNTSIGHTAQTWNFGDGSGTSSEINPKHTYPAEMGYYNVTLVVANSHGCQNSVTQTIMVDNMVVYYIPNTFTPNGDKFNETFKPIFTSGFDIYNYNMIIFNRWGEIVFESNNAQVGWDGTYGGELCPSGTYIWQIRYKELGKDRHQEIRGHVHLLR